MLSVPPQFFGARLERILAPRHAFLMLLGLPHGRQLFTIESSSRCDNHDGGIGSYPLTKAHGSWLWHEFIQAGRTSKQFAAMCRSWKERFSNFNNESIPSSAGEGKIITSLYVEAFDALFARGLMAAARNELTLSKDKRWPGGDILPTITANQLIPLLVHHGANIQERDHGGATVVHWAAGSGPLATIRTIIDELPWSDSLTNTEWDRTNLGWIRTERDGATPLHWAAAGTTPREFGTGGHADIVHYLISCVPAERRSEYVNTCTKDGNSPLMWASWSGSIEVVQYLIGCGANVTLSNRNGCTVAHWASSGGSLAVCRYLADVGRIDFTAPNHGGNTPLTHAVAFGRTDVVAWFREQGITDDDNDRNAAYELAQQFVAWTDGNVRRQEVLHLLDTKSNGDNYNGIQKVEL